MTFAQQVLQFITVLNFPNHLPGDIQVMNPFHDRDTLEICRKFYEQFYADNNKRWMVLGINPGRFGGGVTGIPFTDPIRLETNCGIINGWAKKQELSSLFIYDMIKEYGGVKTFYDTFYITAISPLGFMKDNKNLNYYDDKTLLQEVKTFAIDCLCRQLEFGIYRNAAFCLGDGKNYKFASQLNNETKFFDKLVPLPHPRFIMQYKLRKKQEYIHRYISQFHEFCH